DGAPPPPSGGRPLDLAAGCGVLAALAGQASRGGSTPALGAAAAPGTPHAGSRPACLRWTFGHFGHSGPGAATPPKSPRPPSGPTSWTRPALSGRPSSPPQRSLRSQSVIQSQVTYADPRDWITHVGIYLGGGLQINAPTEGQVVSIQPVFSGFWGAHFAAGGRVLRP